MNKTLRFMMVALVAFISSVAFAQTTVTFTAGTDKGSCASTTDSPAGADQVTKDGVTIATTNGAFAAAQYRIFKGQTFTATSTVGKITSIVFTCTANGTSKYGPGCFENQGAGSYSFSPAGNTGMWEGEADSVILKASSNQVRCTEIVVTVSGTAEPSTKTATPVISGETPFAESTTVTITCADEGATILYTTNGQTPDDREGITYTGPFTLSETATVTAIAQVEGKEQSAEATKTFTKEEVARETIASLNEKTEDEKNVNLTLTNAKVVYVNGTTAHVREGGKAVMFYNTGLELKQNQTVNGSVNVDYDNYYGIHEVKKNDNTNADALTLTDGADETTLDATPATIAEIKALSHIADLVKIEGVTIVTSGKNTYAVAGTDSLQLFKNIANLDGVQDGKAHTIYALFNNIYKGTPEVSVVAVDATETPEETIEEAANIAAFLALADDTKANLKLENAKVVYSWTSNKGNTQVYVRDNSGAVEFYKTALQLNTNDDVNGTVIVKRDSYNNLPEAVDVDETSAEKLTITAGEAAEPKATTVAEAKNYVSDLVELSDVNVVADGNKAYAVSGTDSIQIYNGFHLEDVTLDATEHVNIKGIIAVYKTTYEIYPIEPFVATGIRTIENENAESTDAIYNIAGQRVSTSYKGLVIRNGKKYIK